MQKILKNLGAYILGLLIVLILISPVNVKAAYVLPSYNSPSLGDMAVLNNLYSGNRYVYGGPAGGIYPGRGYSYTPVNSVYPLNTGYWYGNPYYSYSSYNLGDLILYSELFNGYSGNNLNDLGKLIVLDRLFGNGTY